jgi:hypothetical protein
MQQLRAFAAVSAGHVRWKIAFLIICVAGLQVPIRSGESPERPARSKPGLNGAWPPQTPEHPMSTLRNYQTADHDS